MAGGACLGIDTATSRGSVALVPDHGEILLVSLGERGGHARDLMRAIEGLLGDAHLLAGDLRAIGVVAGPGSFTGVRVGMATAKGLGYALGIGIDGLSTLEALALAAVERAPSGTVHLAPVLPAGRGEVYSALFALSGSGVERRTEDRAWRPEALIASLPEDAVLVDGHTLPVGEPPGPGRLSIDSPPLAPTIARWAASRIPSGARYRQGGLVPNYVRPSDAEAARRRD